MGKNKRHSIRQTDISNFNILLVTSLLEKQNLFLQRQMYHKIQFYFITDIHYGIAWDGTRLKRKRGIGNRKCEKGRNGRRCFFSNPPLTSGAVLWASVKRVVLVFTFVSEKGTSWLLEDARHLNIFLHKAPHTPVSNNNNFSEAQN